MKVTIHVTLDIDSRAWAHEYGLETSAEVREDVKTYVRENMIAFFTDRELLITRRDEE